MPTDTTKRMAAYGTAALVAGALLWLGFRGAPPPGADHYLLQAEVKLRFATLLPATGKDGQPVAARVSLITEAEEWLARAERMEPGLPQATEYRGYVHYLRGELPAAAACYQRARGMLDPGATAYGMLQVNEARMLAMAGDDPSALAVLREHGGVQGPCQPAAQVEEARILARLGQPVDALRCARGAAAAAPADGPWLEAGLLLEELGDHASAASTYARLTASQPLAGYFGARLKARAGETDSALQMLERAVEGAGPEVYRLLRKDAGDWQTCAATQRFQDLFPQGFGAEPGRDE